jgi:hypothetical protein
MTVLLWFGWVSRRMRKVAGFHKLQDEWTMQALWEYV